MSVTRARQLRNNTTDAERRLWARLRRRQIAGCRFRRQVPLGAFIVDFACLAARLVVEVDGGRHAEHARRDADRTRWLEDNGFRVLRFWNNEVLANSDGVIAEIARVLRARSPARPRIRCGKTDPRGAARRD